jgi:alpha-amylase
LQSFKDDGVFVYERLGGPGLLVGLNKDGRNSRTVTVATSFGPHVALQEFTGHGSSIRTDTRGDATITIPRNEGGRGYLCYSRPHPHTEFTVDERETTQEYAGAEDLDIRPADNTDFVTVCRVWAKSGTTIRGALFFDNTNWARQTSIKLQLLNRQNTVIASTDYAADTPQGTAITARAENTGFHVFRIRSFNTPETNLQPAYFLKIIYLSSQTL